MMLQLRAGPPTYWHRHTSGTSVWSPSGPLSTWRMMSSFLLTADDVSFDQPTTEHASFLGHRTVLTTETFLLPDLESGTICHRNCDTWISALDNLETCWNRICFAYATAHRDSWLFDYCALDAQSLCFTPETCKLTPTAAHHRSKRTTPPLRTGQHSTRSRCPVIGAIYLVTFYDVLRAVRMRKARTRAGVRSAFNSNTAFTRQLR